MKTISFKRLVREYPYESLLLGAAAVICFISVTAVLLPHSSKPINTTPSVPPDISTSTNSQITVDISGSVNKPDMYTFTHAPRIKEVLAKAGGLSSSADQEFVNRNFNLARFVSDQEKIYVPSKMETQNQIFLEEHRTLQYLSPVSSNIQTNSSTKTVQINSATTESLEKLDGIGPALAKAIIANRPYTSVNDLTSKKVLKPAQFNKIKDQISL